LAARAPEAYAQAVPTYADKASSAQSGNLITLERFGRDKNGHWVGGRVTL
jgi:hypothetical protein